LKIAKTIKDKYGYNVSHNNGKFNLTQGIVIYMISFQLIVFFPGQDEGERRKTLNVPILPSPLNDSPFREILH
jgi:hypothetical protein